MLLPKGQKSPACNELRNEIHLISLISEKYALPMYFYNACSCHVYLLELRMLRLCLLNPWRKDVGFSTYAVASITSGLSLENMSLWAFSRGYSVVLSCSKGSYVPFKVLRPVSLHDNNVDLYRFAGLKWRKVATLLWGRNYLELKKEEKKRILIVKLLI